jgi:hypothetical protein
MFVQVMEATVDDRESLERQLERWESEVRPGAVGFLHSTEGITDDGRLIVVAAFESSDAAGENAARPEQGQWFTETEKYLGSAPSFAEADDTEVLGEAPAAGAGFVQVMKGSADRDRVHAMDELFERFRGEFRPDVIGLLRAWTGPTDYVEVAYFSSEEEARAGESQEPPAELAEQMGDFAELGTDIEFLDLGSPTILIP